MTSGTAIVIMPRARTRMNDAGPLAARQRPHELPMVVSPKTEAFKVRIRLDDTPAEFDLTLVADHVVEDRLLRIEVTALLVEIVKLDGLS